MTSTPREPFFQTESLSVPCDDYMAFKSALSELRKIDDRITFPLNRLFSSVQVSFLPPLPTFVG